MLKMTWMFFNVSQKYNQDIVTFQQLFANNAVVQTKVRLNILFPPVFESKVISAKLKLNENNFVVIGFQANLLNKLSVEISPPASNVRTFVETNNYSESFVFLYFEKVTKDNIGNYNISIKSGSPFNTSDVITLAVTLAGGEIHCDMTVAVVVLSCSVAVLFVAVVVAIGVIVYHSKVFKDKEKEPNQYPVALTIQPSNDLGRSLPQPEPSDQQRQPEEDRQYCTINPIGCSSEFQESEYTEMRGLSQDENVEVENKHYELDLT